MNQPNPKLNINQNSEELKIYMFTVQGGVVQMAVPEDFKAVLAYNDRGAIEMIRKDYPAGVPINVNKRAEVPVRKIVDAINLQPDTPMKVALDTPAPITKEKSTAEFVYGMMLIADKFVENERDRASLKRILGKIKINENIA